MIAVPTHLGIHELVVITIDPDLELSNGISSLKNHKVGYIAGWIMIEPLLKHLKNSFAIADKYTLFSMLKPDRFDAILFSKQAATELIRQDTTGTMRILEPVIRTSPLYLFMHKKHQKMLPKISKKIKQLKNGKDFKF